MAGHGFLSRDTHARANTYRYRYSRCHPHAHSTPYLHTDSD
jgi:hypothetical protein